MANASAKQSKFEMVLGAVDKMSGPFGAMQRKLEGFSAGVGKLRGEMSRLSAVSGFTRLGAGVANVGQKFRAVWQEGRDSLTRLGAMAAKLGVVMGAAGGGALALARATAQAGDAAAKAASSAGVGLAVWQEYAHAASLSNVSPEQLSKSFLKVQDLAIKAAQGEKTQMSLLKLAGIDPRNARGEVKSAEGLMLELSDKVKALVDSGQKAKAVNLMKQILGDEGAKLMPMLEGGREALKDMRQDAHKLGLVFGEDDAKNSAAFNDSLTRAGGAIRGIGYSIGKVVLPPLTRLVEKFTEWAARMREGMGTGFAQWVESIDIDALWQSVEGFLGTLGRFWQSVRSGVEFLGGWGNVCKILAAVIAGKFVLALGGLALAFGNLGLAILTTPVGWFLAAIAAIGAGAYAIYKNWGAISEWFSAQWQGIRAAFEENWLTGILQVLNMFNPVALVAGGVTAMVKYFTGIDLSAIGREWIDSLLRGLQEKWEAVRGWAGGIASSVKGFFGFGSDDTSAAAPAPVRPSAEPLNAGAAAAGVAVQRSEHVERQQLDIRVTSADGTPLSAGMSGNSGNAALVGQQMR